MKINLIDQLTLLSLDDQTGNFTTDYTAYSYSIAGAVLMELSLHNRIEIYHQNKILVKDTTPTGDALIDIYLDKIVQAKKEQPINEWLSSIADDIEAIKQKAITKLIEQKILIQKDEKVLWLFTVHKYPAQNHQPEDHLKLLLQTILDNDIAPQLNECMLLSLIDACQLYSEVFGKEKAKAYEQKVKRLINNGRLSNMMNQTVKEVHEAIQSTLFFLLSGALISTTTVTIN